MPDWVPINMALIKQPLNWVVIFFMVIIPLTALALIAPTITPDQ